MNKEIWKKDGFTFEKVSKKTARAAYNNGLTVLVSPCNICPFCSSWYPYYGIGLNRKNSDYDNFDKVINAFIYYNCDHERGYYPSYYIPVKDVDEWTYINKSQSTESTIKIYDYSFMEVV